MERTEESNGDDLRFAISRNEVNRFPLSVWEVAAASTVVMSFVLGLLLVYLTMPVSDYSFLKLPKSLEDLQILRKLLALFRNKW